MRWLSGTVVGRRALAGGAVLFLVVLVMVAALRERTGSPNLASEAAEVGNIPPPVTTATTPEVTATPTPVVSRRLRVFVNTATGMPNVSPGVFLDPAAFCRAVGTMGQPREGEPYSGFTYLGTADGRNAVQMEGDPLKGAAVRWRCLDGQLLACDGDAGWWPCSAISWSTEQVPGAVALCLAQPNRPMPVLYQEFEGYWWHCKDGMPERGEERIRHEWVDERGYLKGVYFPVN